MNFTMNNKTITKIVLAVAATGALALYGLTKMHAEYLPLLGKLVSGAVALAILAMAATDNTNTKRLN